MRIERNAHGQLCVAVPRAGYGALAGVLLIAAAALSLGWADWFIREIDLPLRVRWIAWAFCGVFGVALLVQALWGRPLIFDPKRAALVRGSRVVARFADVQAVELREVRGDDGRFFQVRLQLVHGRSVLVARTSSDIDADWAAARVGEAVGQPVKHVVR